MKMHNPPHPGEVLRELCLKPLGLTVTQAARALDVSRKTLSGILNGRAGISPEMAVRLSLAFGTSAESWMNQQIQYDLWQRGPTLIIFEVQIGTQPSANLWILRAVYACSRPQRLFVCDSRFLKSSDVLANRGHAVMSPLEIRSCGQHQFQRGDGFRVLEVLRRAPQAPLRHGRPKPAVQ
jgi:addiction module HigA family antidote